MAGTSNPVKSHWPHGEGSLIPMKFHWEHVVTDTVGYKIVGAETAQFDYTVEKAELMVREGGWAGGGDMLLKVTDDTGSPQTIIAAYTMTTSLENGVPVALTVADKGPILTGGILIVSYDSGADGGALVRDACLTLWVRPKYG